MPGEGPDHQTHDFPSSHLGIKLGGIMTLHAATPTIAPARVRQASYVLALVTTPCIAFSLFAVQLGNAHAYKRVAALIENAPGGSIREAFASLLLAIIMFNYKTGRNYVTI
jgi:hypothetical protein